MTQETLRHEAAAGPVTDGPRRTELPAWPVLALLWGIPVLWLAGLFALSSTIMAVPMAAYLILHRRVIWVPGILPLVAFVIWTIAAGMMLEPGDTLGWTVEVAHWTGLAILLIYVVNARERLTKRRLLLGLTFMWWTVIIGGYLGLLFPQAGLTYTVGSLLPGGIQSNEYVQDLAFPNFAEVQTPYGADQPIVRPSAPFSYANGWGGGMAVLTPIAIATAVELKTVRAYALLLVGLVASVVPMVASQNRGAYLGIGVVLGLVALRLAWRGRFGSLVVLAAGAAAAAAAFLQLGLLEILERRAELAQSSVGRQLLYEEAFTRTLDSPFLGYGMPRDSYFSEITVGTQGEIWNAMFTTGFVGLGLFVLFLAGAAIRCWPADGTTDLWLSGLIVSACLLATYYGLENDMIMLSMVIGLLLRQRYLPDVEEARPVAASPAG